MNSLSWMIYGAEVVGNLRGVLIAGAILGNIAIAVGMLIGGIGADVADFPKGTWKKPMGFLWIPVACTITAVVLPSTTTIYMIAASEAGEQIVTSPDAIEMMGDLKAIIKKRLKEELGDAK